MKALVNGLEKFNQVVFAVEKWALIVAVIVMVAVNFAQVISRYVFHYGIPWSEQLSVVLFMFMILIGGNIAIKEDGEIKIEILRFKDVRKDKVLRLITDFVGMVTLGFLFASSLLIAQHGAAHPQVLSALPLTYFHLYCVMAVGFGLMLIEKITNFFKKVLFLSTKEETKEVQV